MGCLDDGVRFKSVEVLFVFGIAFSSPHSDEESDDAYVPAAWYSGLPFIDPKVPSTALRAFSIIKGMR